MADPTVLAAYFLDVGQGDCTFVIPPDLGDTVLFDCADAFVAERFVRDHGISRLGSVVISHLDRDHVGGMLPFLRSFLESEGKIGKVYVSIDRRVDERGLPGAKGSLVAQLIRWEKERILDLGPAHRERSGPRVLCQGSGWAIELVLPFYTDAFAMEGGEGKVPNVCSAALRLVCGTQAALVGADVPLASWEKLEAQHLRAGTFRVPHHGGKLDESPAQWTLQVLYDRVGAGTCCYSVGTCNGHGHPRLEHVLASRRQGKGRIVCTQVTRQCHPDPLAHRDQALAQASGIVYPYRHRGRPGAPGKTRPQRESPCAGSAMLVLRTQGEPEFEPGPQSWHAEHVQQMDSPLCRR